MIGGFFGWCLVFRILWGIARKLLHYGKNFCMFCYEKMKALITLMSTPFGLLRDKLKAIVVPRLHFLPDWDQKFLAFNGFLPFVLFAGSFVLALILCLVRLHSNDEVENFLVYIVYNTTIGSFFGFMDEGFDFTPAAIVAVAFSGYLFSACTDAHTKTYENEMGEQVVAKPKFYIRILTYVVYLLMTALLAMSLTNVFQIVGQWGYETILSLSDMQNGNFFVVVVKLLALLPLGYIALLLMLVTIKEYTECLVLGFLGMSLMMLGVALLSTLQESHPALCSFLACLWSFALLFGLDAVRDKLIQILEAALRRKKK